MRRIAAFLLVGTLSMFFAEVCSGASQMWYLSAWGLLVTFPLYLTHVLFFLWLGTRTRRTTLAHLYLLGVLFGLYESWITKVLWAGYFDAQGPQFGTFLGLAVFEFPILVFFWHPVMSFILPVLAFESLTGKALDSHGAALERSNPKTAALVVMMAIGGAFAASGNGLSFLGTNLSILGTLAIAAVLALAIRGKGIDDIRLGKWGVVAVICYLFALYGLCFVLLLPERLPSTATPYLVILGFYLLASVLFLMRRGSIDSPVRLDRRGHYGWRHFALFSAVVLVSANVYCLLPTLGFLIFVLAYLSLTLLGVGMFAYTAGTTVVPLLTHRNL